IARERKVPYLGICLGMQVAVIEFARDVAGLEGANSTEFDPYTPHPVIGLMPEQLEVEGMGGTMRLGSWPMQVFPGTLLERVYRLTGGQGGTRSEEHTSNSSHVKNSYAVFCLKKKKTAQDHRATRGRG